MMEATDKKLPQGLRLLFSVPSGTTEQAVSDAFYAAGIVIPVDAISIKGFPGRLASVIVSVPSDELVRLLQWMLSDVHINGLAITLRNRPNHRAGKRKAEAWEPRPMQR